MITLEVQVPEQQAQEYRMLFQSLAKRKMSNEDFEDILLSLKIKDVASDNSHDYVSAETFLERQWK